jgi:hypothetical protein
MKQRFQVKGKEGGLQGLVKPTMKIKSIESRPD